MSSPGPSAAGAVRTEERAIAWPRTLALPAWRRSGSVRTGRAVRATLRLVLVALAYFFGAKLGFSLTPASVPVSFLWPPNALLMGALLVSPLRAWPAVVAAALPAHLLAEWQADVPLPMVLSWFASNVTEALVGAALVRRFAPRRGPFESLRGVAAFVLGGAIAAPVLSSFLDASLVELNRWGSASFWEVWNARTLSNVLAVLAIVPVVVTWSEIPLPRFGARRALESVVLAGALAAVATIMFTQLGPGVSRDPAILYLPLPLLLWAAVRRGPRGIAACVLFLAGVCIWGALHRRGPFVTLEGLAAVRPLQIFLIVNAVPLLALAAVVRERTAAQESAQRDRQRLGLALDAADMGHFELDRETGRMVLSPKSRELLGFDEDTAEVTAHALLGRVDPRDRGILLETLYRAAETGAPYEVEYRTAGARVERWVMSRGMARRDDEGRVIGIRGVHMDVTSRRAAAEAIRADAELRRREHRLRELADAMPQVVFSALPDGTITYCNARWREMIGLGDEADLRWLESLHNDDRDRWDRAWAACVTAACPLELELRFWNERRGFHRWMLARAVPVRDEWGDVGRWYGTLTDIDDRKRMEELLVASAQSARALGAELELRVAERTAQLSEANSRLTQQFEARERMERDLRASEERFAKAFRALPDAAMLAHLPDARVIAVNERWDAMFGFRSGWPVGRRLSDLPVFRESSDAVRLVARVLARGSLAHDELTMRDRAGSVLQVVLSAETVEVAGEPCMILMLRDVTEARRAEDEVVAQRRQVAHLGRVAVVGEMAGALAHELSQPLAAMLANASAGLRLADRQPAGIEELRAIMVDIVADLRRSEEVIGRIRAMIRRDEPRPERVDVNAVVHDVLALARADLAQRGVRVTTHLTQELPDVHADRVQLQQVFLNLFMNASDAMTEQPRDQRQVMVVTSLERTGHVHISVSDRGPGIEQTQLEAIFQPFVSTKQHGLGLGLTICRTMVRSAGGELWATNGAHGGATMHVTLPLADDPRPPTPLRVLPTVS